MSDDLIKRARKSGLSGEAASLCRELADALEASEKKIHDTDAIVKAVGVFKQNLDGARDEDLGPDSLSKMLDAYDELEGK